MRMPLITGVLCAAALAAAGYAQPASAHAAAQPVPDAAYYETTVTGAEPAVAGVRASVDPHGEWIEVSSSRPGTVLVLGYLNEPYLRITSAGTEENQLSQSALINKSLFGDPAAPGATSVAASWKHISAHRAVRWHDHRIHWMGGAMPPAVAADPTHARVVGTWIVRVLAGTTPVTVHGQLRWIGKPAAPGLTVGKVVAANAGLALLALAAGLGWRRHRRRHQLLAGRSSQPDLAA